jgi:hypothetical protein
MTEAQAVGLLKRIDPEDRVVMSPRPLERMRRVEQVTPRATYEKPTGLWYACGDDWLAWTMAEMPEWLAGYKYVYTLKLDTTEMNMIHTERAFKQLASAYLIEDGAIDWPSVAETYTGIEICPYRRSQRMRYDARWYYAWDVASGCVWDPAAVREIVPVAL